MQENLALASKIKELKAKLLIQKDISAKIHSNSETQTEQKEEKEVPNSNSMDDIFREEIRELKSKNESLISSQKKLASKLNEITEEGKKTRETLEEMEEANKKLRSELEQKEKSLKEIQEKIGLMVSANEALGKKNGKLNKVIKEIETESNVMKDLVRSFKSQIRSKETDIKKHKLRIGVLESEIKGKEPRKPHQSLPLENESGFNVVSGYIKKSLGSGAAIPDPKSPNFARSRKSQKGIILPKLSRNLSSMGADLPENSESEDNDANYSAKSLKFDPNGKNGQYKTNLNQAMRLAKSKEEEKSDY